MFEHVVMLTHHMTRHVTRCGLRVVMAYEQVVAAFGFREVDGLVTIKQATRRIEHQPAAHLEYERRRHSKTDVVPRYASSPLLVLCRPSSRSTLLWEADMARNVLTRRRNDAFPLCSA
ncbi:hypothetical protein GQ600_10386 [Phytophthora cactorum]|nr:hypothetical protein GQ600_10386 [Phytophthora cactorum]